MRICLISGGPGGPMAAAPRPRFTAAQICDSARNPRRRGGRKYLDCRARRIAHYLGDGDGLIAWRGTSGQAPVPGFRCPALVPRRPGFGARGTGPPMCICGLREAYGLFRRFYEYTFLICIFDVIRKVGVGYLREPFARRNAFPIVSEDA